MAEGSGRRFSQNSVVTEDCLEELLDFFVKSAYRAKNIDKRNEIIHKMCLHLVARDYKVEVLDNKGGQLCGHYPSELIVIEGHQHAHDSSNSSYSSFRVNEARQLKELFTTARFARCRSRFVMPVLIYGNKNICRSATLSTMAELYGRSGVDWFFTGGEGIGANAEQARRGSGSSAAGMRAPTANSDSEWALLTRIRGQDVQLLKVLGISLICDLMVEGKKIKYGIPVSSSEKVDKWARYADFLIASLPYPGCEFFKEYSDCGCNPVQLHFDWSQPGVDAQLAIPEVYQQLVRAPFQRYQEWDLVQLTQNYLKLLLSHLRDCDGGLLVHCISGWDRTPVFISLLRLSLWADGVAHQSLSPAEVLYFTLAFDWLTFGHQLKRRHDNGEEIMYFCYDFLKYITSEEYSVNAPDRSRTNSSSYGNSAGGEGTIPRSSSMTGDRAESGASWVSVEDSSRPTPSTDPCTTSSEIQHPLEANGSWHHVSLDCENQSCRYSTSPPASISSSLTTTDTSSLSNGSASSPGYRGGQQQERVVSVRAKRLTAVRELFIKVYSSSVPEVQEPTSGFSIAGIFSKLTSTLTTPV